MNNCVRERISLLREHMHKDGIDYYVIFTADPHGSEYLNEYYKFREYISGFTGSAGTVLIGKYMAGLWTDGRYFTQANSQLAGSGIELFKMGEPGVPTIKEYIEENAVKGSVIAFDGLLCSKSEYEEYGELTDKGFVINHTKDYANDIWIDRPRLIPGRVYGLDISVTGEEAKDKLIKLGTYIKDNAADLCVLTELSDIMWLFNLRGSDIEYTPVAYSYAIVDKNSKGKLYLYQGVIDDDNLTLIENIGIELCEYDDFHSDIAKIAGKKIIIDDDTVSYRVYETLNRVNELKEISSSHYIKKHIKNATQVKLSKKYHYADGLAVTKWIYEIKQKIENGECITEYEVAKRMDEIRAEDADFVEPSFETICACGENAAIVHYSPNQNEAVNIENNSFMLLDSGGQYVGATTDVTRTIATGNISRKMQENYTRVLKGHLDILNTRFKKGCTGREIDIIARLPLWEQGLDYRHGTGHGVGSMLSVHEGPQRISNKAPISPDGIGEFEAGMITSDEPGLYIEGEYGIRIENLMLCNKVAESEWGEFLGFENLTFVPYEIEAIIPEMLTEQEKTTLNSINSEIYRLYSGAVDENMRSWLEKVTAKL